MIKQYAMYFVLWMTSGFHITAPIKHDAVLSSLPVLSLWLPCSKKISQSNLSLFCWKLCHPPLSC